MSLQPSSWGPSTGVHTNLSWQEIRGLMARKLCQALRGYSVIGLILLGLLVNPGTAQEPRELHLMRKTSWLWLLPATWGKSLQAVLWNSFVSAD